MQVKDTLHDFSPLDDYKKSMRSLEAIWCVLFVSFIAFLLTNTLSILEFNWIFWAFVVALFIGFWGVLFMLSMGKIATNWDDMDYNELIKRDVDFRARDGKKLFAYIYYRKNLEEQLGLNDREKFNKKPPKKLPTIIGFHGWGAHHREMDRYCLPTVFHKDCLYFTFDSVGQGQTPGDKNDFRQFDDCEEFIAQVRDLPIVDERNIIVVGMSMGAAKTAVTAYPNPDVKAVAMLSGPYDYIATLGNITFTQKFLFFLSRSNLNQPREKLIEYSGVSYFKREGIVLRGEKKPTPNKERVFLAANMDDPVVNWRSTKKAIDMLNLPPENYRIFEKGNHCFESGEYYLSVDLYRFLSNQLP